MKRKTKREPKLPLIGFVALWPNNQIVKVKIDRQTNQKGYPFQMESLDPKIRLVQQLMSNLEGITLYKTEQAAEKGELEKLHTEYRQAKRALRNAEKRVKFANRRVFEFKNFGKLVSVYFTDAGKVVA